MKKILIYGLKKSGQALIEFLNEKYEIIVYDENSLVLEEFIKRNKLKYSFNTLENIKQLNNIDLAVISPGIYPDNKLVKYLKGNGVKVENEMDFASNFISGDIISVTGTNGKSTVSTLIYQFLLSKYPNSFLTGNIGVPLTECLSKCDNKSKVVVEASSFQLYNIYYHHPKIAILLNIAPDHITWHGSFENYFNSKKNIFKYQCKKDYSILNFDDENVKNIDVNGEKYFFSLTKKVKGCYLKNNYVIFYDGKKEEKVLKLNNDFLCKHMIANYLASICAAKLCGVENEIIRNVLDCFKGLEHRFEFVIKDKGVTFINDSKATNVASTRAAIMSSKAKTRLLLGGSDKGECFDDLFNLPEINKVIKVYVYGQTKTKIIESAKKFNIDFEDCLNLKDATLRAYLHAENGDYVLLSPACASFDEFTSFEQRGDFYKELVKNIIYERVGFN